MSSSRDSNGRLNKDTFKDRQSTPIQDMQWVYEHLDLNVTATDAPSGGAWSMLENARLERQKFFDRAFRIFQKMEDNEVFEAEIKAHTRLQDNEIAARLTPPKVQAERVEQFLEKAPAMTDEQWARIQEIVCQK